MPTVRARFHDILFALFCAGVLAYGAIFAGYLLVKFDLLNILRDVNLDDSFYYFQIAHHLSEGRFSTFDGGITQTNGYHPVWLLLITPLFWFLDKEAALFAIKALEIMLIAGAVVLIASAAKLARLPWYLLAALPPVLYGRPILYSGLEAAAALFMLGLLFLTLVLYTRDPQRWTWPLTVVAFALPWVRLEYMAVSLAATGALVFIRSPRRESADASGRAADNSTPPPPKLRTFVPLAGAIAGILVYFAYNWLIFSGIVPVSGVIKSEVLSIRLWRWEGGFDLLHNFQGTWQVPAIRDGVVAAAVVCGLALGAGALALYARRRGIPPAETSWFPVFMAGGLALAAGHLAKFIQSGLLVHPFQSRYLWYYVPAYLTEAMLVPLACFSAVYAVRLLAPPRAGRVMVWVIVLSGSALLITQASFRQPFQFVAASSAQHSKSSNTVPSYLGSLAVDRLLPEGSVVGSWDAGVLGYFSRFPVVNLDGVVNSYEYLRVLREGYVWAFVPPSGGEQARFVQRLGVTHFANISPRTRAPVHRLYHEGDFGPASGSTFKIWATEPDTAAINVWERMRPHFAYQSDQGDIGLLLDGRLAQALARDCAPGDLAVWSHAEPVTEMQPRPWVKTQTGLCMDTRVLSQDQRPPLRIETMTVSEYREATGSVSRPAIQGAFDVHFAGDILVYMREQCRPADTEAWFFLHVTPADINDLPAARRPLGFDALGFHFTEYGRKTGDSCLIVRDLPGYPITAIRTGQFVRDGGVYRHLWEGEIRLSEP